MTMVRTLCQRALDGPSMPNAPHQQRRGDADFGAPIKRTLGAALKGDVERPSCVPRLFFARRPTDVARFVITSIVNAVQLMIGCRLAAHVAQEYVKTLSPLRAHADAAATPLLVARPFRVVATTEHFVPRPQFRAAHPTAVWGRNRPRHASDRCTVGLFVSIGIA